MTAIWALLSHTALRSSDAAAEGLGGSLSGIHAFHALMLLVALLYSASSITLTALGLSRLLSSRRARGSTGGKALVLAGCEPPNEEAPSSPPKPAHACGLRDTPAALSALPARWLAAGGAACRAPGVCTAANLLYYGLMVWVLVAMAGYAAWMAGASAVVEGAELTLLDRRDVSSTAGRQQQEQLDPLLLVPANDGSSINGGGSSSRSVLLELEAVLQQQRPGQGCPLVCLDVAAFDFIQTTTTCLCDRSTLESLYRHATLLYDQLVGTMSALLLLYAAAALGLIHASALLAGSGCSELQLVMEPVGDRAPLLPLPQQQELPGMCYSDHHGASTGCGSSRGSGSGIADWEKGKVQAAGAAGHHRHVHSCSLPTNGPAVQQQQQQPEQRLGWGVARSSGGGRDGDGDGEGSCTVQHHHQRSYSIAEGGACRRPPALPHHQWQPHQLVQRHVSGNWAAAAAAAGDDDAVAHTAGDERSAGSSPGCYGSGVGGCGGAGKPPRGDRVLSTPNRRPCPYSNGTGSATTAAQVQCYGSSENDAQGAADVYGVVPRLAGASAAAAAGALEGVHAGAPVGRPDSAWRMGQWQASSGFCQLAGAACQKRHH